MLVLPLPVIPKRSLVGVLMLLRVERAKSWAGLSSIIPEAAWGDGSFVELILRRFFSMPMGRRREAT